MKKIYSVLVENRSGVLFKVAGLFSRRAFNINSLVVGETDDPTMSRMTIVSSGDSHTHEQIEKQLNKKLDVIKVKTFAEDLLEWIDFVCDCRDGKTKYTSYDIIMGKVADDKVFRVVDLYHSGIWNKERAIREIKVYPEYDQIAFITQEAIDKLLVFKSADEV